MPSSICILQNGTQNQVEAKLFAVLKEVVLPQKKKVLVNLIRNSEFPGEMDNYLPPNSCYMWIMKGHVMGENKNIHLLGWILWFLK